MHKLCVASVYLYLGAVSVKWSQVKHVVVECCGCLTFPERGWSYFGMCPMRELKPDWLQMWLKCTRKAANRKSSWTNTNTRNHRQKSLRAFIKKPKTHTHKHTHGHTRMGSKH